MQADGVVSQLLQWTATDYKPDLLLIAVGAHSVYEYKRPERAAASFKALAAGLDAWRALQASFQ